MKSFNTGGANRPSMGLRSIGKFFAKPTSAVVVAAFFTRRARKGTAVLAWVMILGYVSFRLYLEDSTLGFVMFGVTVVTASLAGLQVRADSRPGQPRTLGEDSVFGDTPMEDSQRLAAIERARKRRNQTD